MLSFFQGLAYKTAVVLTASIIAVSGLWQSREITIIAEPVNLPEVDIIQEQKMPEFRPELQGLKKETEVLKNQISLLATSSEIQPKIDLEKKAASASQPPTPSTQTQKTAILSVPKSPVTPEQFLNKTQLTLKQRLDGSYWLEFHTNLAGGTDFKWEPAVPSIGDDKLIPQFKVSFDCNPGYNQVPAGIYSAFSFKIRTSYSCNLVLTDSKGKTAKKQLDFTTGPGFLVVSGASGFSNRLRENVSTNGIVFTNTDDEAVVITGLIFDVSTAAINVLKPAAIRFSDYNGVVLNTYWLEDAPRDPLNYFLNNSRDVQTSFSLKVEPHSAKMVFVEAINIPRLFVDVNPEITLVFNKINTDRTDMRIVPLPVIIYWSCVSKYLPDDPEGMCR